MGTWTSGLPAPDIRRLWAYPWERLMRCLRGQRTTPYGASAGAPVRVLEADEAGRPTVVAVLIQPETEIVCRRHGWSDWEPLYSLSRTRNQLPVDYQLPDEAVIALEAVAFNSPAKSHEFDVRDPS